jgi:glutathione S-transferase
VTLTLYTNPMSRGRIARWMLEEVGEPYERIILTFGPGGTSKSAEFLALNPMGKVPTLVHDGRVVTEAAAICAYCADAFPAAGLAPTAAERADFLRWLFFAAGCVEPAITARSLGVEPPADKAVTAGYGTVDLAVDTFEKAVAAHPFIAGDRFTAADVYVGSMVVWGMGFGSLPRRAAFEDYAARVTARPAYRHASDLDDKDGEAMAPPPAA